MKSTIFLLFSICLYANNVLAEGYYLGASYLKSDQEFNQDELEANGFNITWGFINQDQSSWEALYYDFGTLDLPNLPDAGGEIDGTGYAVKYIRRFPLSSNISLFASIGNLWWERDGVLQTIAGPLAFKDKGSDVIYSFGLDYWLSQSLSLKVETEKVTFEEDEFDTLTLGFNYYF